MENWNSGVQIYAYDGIGILYQITYKLAYLASGHGYLDMERW